MFKAWQRNFTVKRAVIFLTKRDSLNKDGTSKEKEYETFNIKANLQPANSELLQTMPEGNRNKDIYVLYTSSLLRTARAGEYEADIVKIDNRSFKVFKVDNWSSEKMLAHYKVLVINDIITTKGF